MNNESRLWNVLDLLAVIFAAVISAGIGWYSTIRPVEKNLEANQVFATNLIPALDVLGDRLSLSMSFDQRPVKNLISATMVLTNIGGFPIVPSDFYEPLSINVNKPWSILGVVANDPPVSSKWHRVNDQKFEAEGALINPGDDVRVNVYLTNTEIQNPSRAQINDIDLNWATHVANLRQISVRENIFASSAKDYWGVTTIFYGWRTVFFILFSVIFMALYVSLMYKIVLIVRPEIEVIAWVVLAGLISCSASDGLTEILFPSIFTKTVGLSWYNYPAIALSLILLLYLLVMNFRAKRAVKEIA